MNTHHDRQAPRVNISKEVVLEYQGQCLRVSAIDLSERGIGVWVPESATHAPIRLTMALGGRPVILRGRVVRQFESDGGAVWGIEFMTNDDDPNRQIVAEFVDEMLSLARAA